jgi:hypothetical protein
VGALSQKGYNCLKEASPADLAAEGRYLCSTEVWSWGGGSRGQLGQGDMLARPTPAPIPGLQAQFVVKLAVGRHHVVAMTGSGQVYGWGDNSRGQACPTDKLAVVLHPARLQIPQDETARDVAASGNTSLVLTDIGKMYVCGGGDRSTRWRVIQANRLINQPNLLLPVAAFLLPGYFVLNSAPVSEQTASLISREKVMLRQMDGVLHLLQTLFPSSPGSSAVDPTIQTVQQRLNQAVFLLATCVHKSSAGLLLDYTQTGLYRHSQAWEHVVRGLSAAVCDCIAADSLYLDAHQTHHQHLITDLLVSRFGLPRTAIRGQAELEQVLVQAAVKISETYVKGLAALSAAERGEEDEQQRARGLQDRLASLMAMLQEIERERQAADRTRHFWKSVGGSNSRLIEAQLPQRVPSRRLLLDSRYQPVSLSGAMTKHWLLLMSDVLVDYGYQLVVHPLQTIWLESLPASAATARYQYHAGTSYYRY